MKTNLPNNAERYALCHRKRRQWRRVVTCLAGVVVFCTVYALVLPAITLEKNSCSLEEHVHTGSCYTQVTSVEETVPACTLAAHVHTEACKDAEGNAVCGYGDFVVHTHDGNCYLPDGALWCGLPEIEYHTHDGNCYAPAHVHTDGCYARVPGDLLCDAPEHTHADDCYARVKGELLCEDTEHAHTDDCYAWERGERICDSREHTHTDGCYAWETGALICTESTEPVLICDKPVIVPHTHTPYVSKDEPGCYDDAGERLICGETEIQEHSHTAACFQTERRPVDTDALTCTIPEGTDAHAHTEHCYGAWELTCKKQAHTHSEACQNPSNDQARIDECIALIDALPTAEEVEARLAELEASEDEDGYNVYFEEVYHQVMDAYLLYEDIGPDVQQQVTNAEKLLEFTWLWSAQTWDITDTVTIHQVNTFGSASGGTARIILVYNSGNSPQAVNAIVTNMYHFYDKTAITVENRNGTLVVTDVDLPSENSDKQQKSVPPKGFVIILATGQTVTVSVNSTASADFDYTQQAYNTNGLGTVTFTTGEQGAQKPEKNNHLTPIPSASTRDLIEVNLYDYGDTINDRFNLDAKYPGFQQDYGTSTLTSDSTLGLASFNFGDNITADLNAGRNGITVKGGTTINATTTTNTANLPIRYERNVMYPTLVDGYPALADGTSLRYLFTNSAEATKKNTQNIDGLFLYDEQTGAYTFNSRENHAQFNPGSDTFSLYSQILTANFMMYPFGNFLPFNDINTESKQTSTIDRAYLQTIADSAAYKQSQGLSRFDNAYDSAQFPSLVHSEYGVLSSQLNTFLGLMDSVKNTQAWTGADCINQYFTVANIPKTFRNTDAFLQNLYSLDFDEPADFFFGMEMKMNFYQPKGGLTGLDGQQPMKFYFTGDDDVWVYVDGTLFLDLSGIHRHVGGMIDFTNGRVEYYALRKDTGDVDDTNPVITVSFSQLVDSSLLNEKGTFQDYSKHTFHFYYMERGAGSGVCRMNFNFPVLQNNTISVTKRLSMSDGSATDPLGNPDFRFQILKADGQGTPTGELFIPAGTSYNILNAAGVKIGEGIVGANGIFSLKANQTAVFQNISENSGKYFVRELFPNDQFGDIKIEIDGNVTIQNGKTQVSEDFTGVDSPVADASSGNAMFLFDNTVETGKLGSLSITKTLTAFTESSGKTFDFEVTLDDAPLPVGTPYTVNGEARTVQTEGIVTISAGQTAAVSRILAGTQFTVQETSASALGYAVTYTGDGISVESSDDSGPRATGTIQTSAAIAVTCHNTEPGTAITIPVQKTLQNPDGAEHTYTLQLEQVQSQANPAPVNPPLRQTCEITITQAPVSGVFTLKYPKVSTATYPQSFYYKIQELPSAEPAEGNTVFDSSIYLVEVTVRNTGDTLRAEITGVWKDDTKIENSTLSFTNTIQHYELPNTGGSGTWLFTRGGAGLCALAWLAGLRRKKRSR